MQKPTSNKHKHSKILRYFLLPAAIVFSFLACQSNFKSPGKTINNTSLNGHHSLAGTWKLLQGRLIENGDTTITRYTADTSFIKIINQNHFAFLEHDNKKGSTGFFAAGGGHYTLKDSIYTEHLEYCNAREWEDHDFSFTIQIKGDTLIQSGIEQIDSLGINRINTEIYLRIQ